MKDDVEMIHSNNCEVSRYVEQDHTKISNRPILDRQMDDNYENENQQKCKETVEQNNDSSSQHVIDLVKNEKETEYQSLNNKTLNELKCQTVNNKTLMEDALKCDENVSQCDMETSDNCVRHDVKNCDNIEAAFSCQSKASADQEMGSDFARQTMSSFNDNNNVKNYDNIELVVPCQSKDFEDQEMGSDSPRQTVSSTNDESQRNDSNVNQCNNISHDEPVMSESDNGRHIQELRKSLSTIVEKFISHIKFAKFRQNLRPIYQHNPQELKKIHGQFVKQLGSNINEEIEKMIKEENIVGLLNKLDEINSTREAKGVAWRPSGDPKSDVLAHVMPIKVKEQKQLKKMVCDLETQNSLLREALRVKQKKLLDTKHRIEKHFNEISKVSEVDIPTEEIKIFHENNT